MSAPQPRVAVIDAQNLAWAASRAIYGGIEGGRLHFPAGVRALYGAVTALRAAGVEPVAILPEHWLRYRASPGDAVMGALPVSSRLGLADSSPAMGATELEALRALVSSGAAIVAPPGSKEHPMILAYAYERGAWVLSQDRFRDHAAAIRRAAAGGSAAGGGEGMAVDGDAPPLTLSPDAVAARLAWLDTHVLGFSVRPPPAPDRPWEFIVDPQKGARLFAAPS